MATTVALSRCPDYNPTNVQQALERTLALAGGVGSFAHKGDRILLKPNVLMAAPPERAVCTHPLVLRAVIRALKAFGCQVIVAEQPGMGPAEQARKALEVSGTLQVCKEEEVDCVLFRSNGFYPVSLPNGKRLKEVMLPRDFQEADRVVSVAKLKSHMQATYTGAIKNFYGVIPAKQRKEIHGLGRYVPFSEGIVDVFQAARPTFGIIDGIVGMEGRGPSMGNPRQLGILLASSDLVALDRVAVNVVGWERMGVHHITEAASRGLGEGNISRIRVTGEPLDEVRIRFVPPPTAFRSVPGFLLNAFYNFWSIKPEVIREKCMACGTCVSACPVSAITLDHEGKAFVDYGRCVECFCCHELCVYGAVSERPSRLKEMLRPVRRRLLQTKER